MGNTATVDFVASRQDGRVLHIAIDREPKRNALSDSILRRVAALLRGVPGSVGSVVLSGRGEHFSAGLDLQELVERDARGGMLHSRLWHECLDAVQFSPVPVIAALQGAVIGGGLELAAACHLRVADATAFFALPEGARGIFVGGGGSARISRLIGAHRVTDMVLTGRVVEAGEGHRIGLAQYLVPPGEAGAKAAELAAAVAGNTPMTNYAVTHVLPRIADAGLEVGLMTESLAAGIAQSDPAAKERLADFLAGRSAKVTDTRD
ncbi:crotonase/enoyl-CoA hydratase family protein [Amycolatopsis sp. GA6-003]|uniref:crotonase/enoyl-CoA hydratase family protein n=1 Tax=Amycolatopsis sp. GA6-003 TaxID=2652444 RepID=UPI00391750FC